MDEIKKGDEKAKYYQQFENPKDLKKIIEIKSLKKYYPNG